MKTIVVMRHPQKDGDQITPYGAQQAFAAVVELLKTYQFKGVFYSGAVRTMQTSLVAIAAMKDASMWPQKEALLHFQQVLDRLSADEKDRVLKDIPAIKEAGGTVAVALRMGGKYPAMARERMTLAVTMIAEQIQDGEAALAISHAPMAETAAFDPETMPYALGEADAVVYCVKNGKITSSTLVKAPLQGKTN